jgi:hypothetical protein
VTHPFEHWPSAGRRPILIALIASSIAMFVLLSVLDRPLRDSGEGGTVELEVAGGVSEASRIKEAWRADGVLDDAAFIDGLDFLFAPLYAAALAGACVAAAASFGRRGHERLASAGGVIAWMATAAALFDWTENVALAAILLDDVTAPWPGIALAAAIPKFVGSSAGLVYGLAGAAFTIAARNRGVERSQPV